MSRLSRWLRQRRQKSQVDYMVALRVVHEAVAPANYFEIGVRTGSSLALSEAPSIAIDPAPRIDVPLNAPVRLYEMTSDRYFAEEPCAEPIDLGFIDGMHQVEFVLRDFLNIEARAHRKTVVAIDDVLPADISFTPREPVPGAWTGDVYRIIPLLRAYRPDLDVRVYDVREKGLGIITCLDPSSRVLPDMYERIVADLAAGAFLEPSAKAIRDVARPLPTSRLARHLRSFRRARRPA